MWVLPRALSLARARCGSCPNRRRATSTSRSCASALGAVDGVTEVHDLHVWTLVPGKDMVTAHLTSSGDSARVLHDARAVLHARGLDHATIQVEPPAADGDCAETC